MVLGGSNSDRSSQSLVGGGSSKLSHQDLVGYATLRSLRKSPRYLEEPAYDSDEIRNDGNWDVPVSLIEDFNLLNTNTSIKRFSVPDRGEGEDRCYMGVTLPRNINHLFLDSEEARDVSLERFPIIDDEIVYAMHDFKIREETIWKHDTESCFICSWKVPKEEVFIAISEGWYYVKCVFNSCVYFIDPLDCKYNPNSPDSK